MTIRNSGESMPSSFDLVIWRTRGYIAIFKFTGKMIHSSNPSRFHWMSRKIINSVGSVGKKSLSSKFLTIFSNLLQCHQQAVFHWGRPISLKSSCKNRREINPFQTGNLSGLLRESRPLTPVWSIKAIKMKLERFIARMWSKYIAFKVCNVDRWRVMT